MSQPRACRSYTTGATGSCMRCLPSPCRSLGPVPFGLFAAAHNCRTPLLFSWLACLDAVGVNAFSHSWAAVAYVGVLHRPLFLCMRALDRLLAERIKAYLVVPACQERVTGPGWCALAAHVCSPPLRLIACSPYTTRTSRAFLLAYPSAQARH
jgi:hypothetical protein